MIDADFEQVTFEKVADFAGAAFTKGFESSTPGLLDGTNWYTSDTDSDNAAATDNSQPR